MDVNININFGITEQLQASVTRIADALENRHTARTLADIITNLGKLGKAVAKERAGQPSEKEEPACEEEKVPQPQAVSETDPAAPSTEKKPRRVRRTKATEPTPEEAPATPEEAPATPEEPAPSPVSSAEIASPQPEDEPTDDLPFDDIFPDAAPAPSQPQEEAHDLSLEQFRINLNAIRDKLGLNDGQPNFGMKRSFNTLARKLMPYYGGDKADMLTPANLYWYCWQLSEISLEDGEFTTPDYPITPEQVEELKKAPF